MVHPEETTLLMYAFHESNVPLFQTLIDLGADPLDGQGDDFVKHLFFLGFKDSGDKESSAAKNYAMVDILIKANVLPKTYLQHSLDNILHTFIGLEFVEEMQRAIELNASVEAKDKHGFTPIMNIPLRAGTTGEFQFLLLLDAGASLETENPTGHTALHIHVMQQNAGMVQALIDARANPFATSIYGNTPLMLAKLKQADCKTEDCRANAETIVQMLTIAERRESISAEL